MFTKNRRLRNASPLLVALLVLLTGSGITSLALGQDSGSWELRVCADPNSMPFSNDDEEGFENRIAEIMADELGARLTYDWFPLTSDLINLRLRAGECDVIMGLPDGVGSVLNTVAYYRSPYVFLYREDAGFRIESLDDPVLADLRIAVQNTGIPPHDALLDRGLQGNIVYEYLDGEPRIGVSRSLAAINAVVNGEVDVAAVWGPVAGWLAAQADAPLIVQPVTPIFEPPFRTQSFPMTMAVRQGDESLRNRLDVAIANRWEDINAVLTDYSVPLETITQPLASPPRQGVTRFGFIGPFSTGISTTAESVYDIVGDAALNGAQLAEAEVDRLAADAGVEIDLLWSSSPSAAAAQRAAERMVATEDVVGFIGGLGTGQGEVLAQVAQDNDMLFINTGSSTLARTCEAPGTFHIEAGYDQYADALLGWHGHQGIDNWYVIHEDSEDGTRFLEAFNLLADENGASVVGTAAVAVGAPSYLQELIDARNAGADAILGFVPSQDQVVLFGQWQTLGIDAEMVPYPHAISQSRDFMAATNLLFTSNYPAQYVQLWETTLESDLADRLNTTYTSRFGVPMEGQAWSTYTAIRILFQALGAVDGDAKAIVSYLSDPDTRFSLGKGVELAFRDADNQLLQPLYVVQVNPDAQWGMRLTDAIAVADYRDQIPSAEELAAGDPLEVLGQMGTLHTCQ